MNDLVPITSYYPFFLHISLSVVVISLLHAFLLPITSPKTVRYMKVIGIIYLIITLLHIGLRPLNWRFVDMVNYNRIYLGYMNGEPLFTDEDILFHYFMRFCAQVMTPSAFFFICSALYILPMYRVSKALFKDYWFYSFLLLVVSFSFWPYATNGIRNGIATSLFLLGISFYPKRFGLILFLILSTLIHRSLVLPVLAIILTRYYSNSKTFLIFWLLSIPLSLIMGSFWESLFASIGFGDEKLSGYLVGGNVNNDNFKSTGFRFDFVIYSAGAVFAGWYFIFRKNFKDVLYNRLFNTYLICNGFWILVIRANFSNRFAYLSWFLMGIIIIYPFLKKEYFKLHHIRIGIIFTIYYMFTFLMHYIYYHN